MVTNLYVHCTRCNARHFLYSLTPEQLQHGRGWIVQHQAEAHSVDDLTHRELDRWLLGYRSDLPPPPYTLQQEMVDE